MSQIFTMGWIHTWLVPFMWTTTICSLSMTIYQFVQLIKMRRHWRRESLTSQYMLAEDFARFAVYESWIRSGARTTPFAEEVEFEMRQRHANRAKLQGDEFFRRFVQGETAADKELDAVIRKLGGTLTHDSE